MNSIPKAAYPINGACEARKQSECEAAYQALYKSQDDLNETIAALHSRLSPVLSNRDGSACDAPSQAASSEVHGWLIAAEERNYAVVRRIRAIIESLTI